MTSSTGGAQTETQEQIHKQSMALAPSATGIIPFMDDEIVRLEEEAKRFQNGELENTEFTPFRLRQGVYGQRQPDVQMVRIKLPGGIVTADALDMFGDISGKYVPLGKGHVTTRENVQFHHIPLEQCPEILRSLGTVGLSTREACGNAVRNVISSPGAGVCPDEVFDPTPYLAAYVRFGVRHPLTQNFPRKFKTAFTGCDSHDTVAAAIQDLTFVSQTREVDGVTQRGFRIFVGGGTSIMPRLAKPFYDFLPEEDYLRVTLAIWTVFNNALMLRKNRMMARLKVLIDRIGLDAFRQEVDEELEKIGPIDYKHLMEAEEVQRETPPALDHLSFDALELNGSSANGQHGDEEFNHWVQTNVSAQKQEGYYLVYVKLTRGDITTSQFHGLADIVRRYTGGRARTNQEQNLALRWVPGQSLKEVWQALNAIDLAEADVHTITDVVSCPGTDSCKLGITASMGLAKAIEEDMTDWNGILEDEGVRKIRIKMSGCPNGCGLHHIANIGFHGAAVKGPDGEQIPSYELFLGGNYGDNRVEDSSIGTRIPKVKVPAKAVPGVIKEITTYYKENRRNQESFNQFLERVGVTQLTAVAAQAQSIAESTEAGSDLYFDWERTNIYKLERGEGECMV
ncbi:MAG: ferredoxin--nitrite reductase [Planctomyces sp.]|nr:ferredoxin--nitrite reductase [Planctomyces sp.]